MKHKSKEKFVPYQENPLIDMLQKGNATRASILISTGQLPLNIRFVSLENRSLLHLLVENQNNNELLAWLLENRRDELDINALDGTDSTPIMLAAEAKNVPAIELLLAYNARIDIKNKAGQNLVEVVRIFDYNSLGKVKRLIAQAQEGRLEKPASVNTNLPLKKPPSESVLEAKFDNRASRFTQSLHDSFWKFIGHFKSPTHTSQRKKPAHETKSLLDEQNASDIPMKPKQH